MSSHLSDEQLGARRDGALATDAAASVDRHLAGCAECRERLAALVVLDASLAAALEHDPGEAYFAAFEGRVAARIAAAPTPAAVPVRRGFAAWWNSPRALAWTGGALGVVAIAALVATLAQQHGPEELARRAAPSEASRQMPRTLAAEPARPSTADQVTRAPTPRRELARPAPPAAEANSAAQGAPAAAAPGAEVAPSAAADARGQLQRANVMEARTLPNGEQVPAHSQLQAKGGPAPAPPIRLKSGLMKPATSPMAEQSAAKSLAGPADAGAPRAFDAFASRAAVAADSARLCGVVIDTRGRPAAGATVFVAETGAAATTDADGGWCVAFPARGGTLSVLAVGYHPFRARLAASDARRPFAVTLAAVDALGGSAASTLYVQRGGGVSGEREALPKYGGTDPARRAAMDASALATKSGVATDWDAAARLWSAAAASESDARATDALFHAAEARVNAWRAERTEARRAAADSATSRFLDRGEPGARRDVALGWRSALGR